MVALESHVEVLSALRLGWTVRCRLLELALPVGGIELTVHDAREDEDALDGFQVLTLQGWHSATSVWAIEGSHLRELAEDAVVEQERLFK